MRFVVDIYNNSVTLSLMKGFYISLSLGVAVSNGFIGYFIKRMSIKEAVAFGLLAGAICFGLTTLVDHSAS